MSTITIPRSEVLDLINCAEDYGFHDNVLFDAFATWPRRHVTDAEIAAYAAAILTPAMRAKGYGEEDAEGATRRLEAFRADYCDGKKAP